MDLFCLLCHLFRNGICENLFSEGLNKTFLDLLCQGSDSQEWGCFFDSGHPSMIGLPVDEGVNVKILDSCDYKSYLQLSRDLLDWNACK